MCSHVTPHPVYVLLGFEPRVSCMLGKYSINWLYISSPRSWFLWIKLVLPKLTSSFTQSGWDPRTEGWCFPCLDTSPCLVTAEDKTFMATIVPRRWWLSVELLPSCRVHLVVFSTPLQVPKINNTLCQYFLKGKSKTKSRVIFTIWHIL